MPFNIFSGSRDGNGLAAALTNPTCLSKRKGTIQQQYPVFFRGRVWPDAETAYLTLSAKGMPVENDRLMIDIIEAKLYQHPRLGYTLTKLGGVDFLRKCTHYTYAKSDRFQQWEGYGEESRFIRNLIAAYQAWANA